jgi:hypothetical protein
MFNIYGAKIQAVMGSVVTVFGKAVVKSGNDFFH